MTDEELDRTLVLNAFARKETRRCDHCDAKGYYYPEDHPDYEEARAMVGRVERLRTAKGSARVSTA
jgi:hypothetical protein